jgi:hypothetical protein
VRITKRTPLRQVALAVGRALAGEGIRAVLTGGACASIHAEGHYLSADVDFVLEGQVVVADLDRAMAKVGFYRDANRYLHPRSPFWVEFPRGPLAVGGDLDVRPMDLEEGSEAPILALSPTDSCRDRLAAFYHWNDRQSLGVALEIASRHDLDLERIRRWSAREGHAMPFEEFLLALSRKPRRRIARRGRP